MPSVSLMREALCLLHYSWYHTTGRNTYFDFSLIIFQLPALLMVPHHRQKHIFWFFPDYFPIAWIITDRRVTVRETAAELSLSIGSVETIIHKLLKFRKVSTRWVPKLLNSEQKPQRHYVSRSSGTLPTRARQVFESHYYLWWNTGSPLHTRK